MNPLDLITHEDMKRANGPDITLYHWRRWQQGQQDAHLPALLAALTSNDSRDGVLVAMASGRPVTYASAINVARYHALDGAPPQIERSTSILNRLAALAPHNMTRAFPLAMIAFLHWRNGDHIRADAYCSAALLSDESNVLASYVNMALEKDVTAQKVDSFRQA